MEQKTVKGRIKTKDGLSIEVEGSANQVDFALKSLIRTIEKEKNPVQEEILAAKPDKKTEDLPLSKSLAEWIRIKDPKHAYEAIPCVLYYKKKFKGENTMEGEDIQKELNNVGFKEITQFGQAIYDCMKIREFIRRPSKSKWEITDSGEKFVEKRLPGPFNQKKHNSSFVK